MLLLLLLATLSSSPALTLLLPHLHTPLRNASNRYLGACLGMDCGGGKCSRGVCVCNDNFEKNAAGRCIPLPPFPKKKLEEAAGGFVSFMFFCVCCAMCRSGKGDEGDGRGGAQRKKPGCCARLRKCIFPYKFVLVRGGKNKPAAPAPSDEMGVLGGSAGGVAPGTFGGGGTASFTPVPTQPPASEQGFSNAYQGGYSGSYDGGGGGGGAASNISYTSNTYGESGADMII